MTKQSLADHLAVKFSVILENVSNTREAIGSGTLDDAIRAAKQLAYSANSLVSLLNELKLPSPPSVSPVARELPEPETSREAAEADQYGI
jgi:hypothetical protein